MKVEYNIFGGNLANSAFAKYLSVYVQNINIQFTCIQSVYEIENRYGGECTRLSECLDVQFAQFCPDTCCACEPNH